MSGNFILASSYPSLPLKIKNSQLSDRYVVCTKEE
jgi:hypothetical protein